MDLLQSPIIHSSHCTEYDVHGVQVRSLILNRWTPVGTILTNVTHNLGRLIASPVCLQSAVIVNKHEAEREPVQ